MSLQLFVVIIGVLFKCCSLEQSLTDKICSESSMTVDSIARIYGTNYLYLIAEDMIFKMKVRSDGRSEIKSVRKLEEWSPEIRSNIHIIYTTKKNPNYIYLTNCKLRKEWIVKHEDNLYNGSRDANCHNEIEYVIDAEKGDQYFMESSPEKRQLWISAPFYGLNWHIKHASADPNLINGVPIPSVGFPDLNDMFYLLDGKPITAAFIDNENWYLFAGRHYCKVTLMDFEECKPLPITDWIVNCRKDWEQQSNESKENKDISLYIVIGLAVVAIAVIIIIVFVILINREFRKRGTDFTHSSSRGSSTQS